MHPEASVWYVGSLRDGLCCRMTTSPRKLQVLDRAFALAVLVHRLADRHQHAIARVSIGMRAQMLRSADAIPFHLAEFTTQTSIDDSARVLTAAIGACNELELQLRLAGALEAVDAGVESLIEETLEVRAMTAGLRRHILGRTPSGGSPRRTV